MAENCPDCATVNNGNPKIAGHTAEWVKLHPCDVEALGMAVGIEASMAPIGCLLDVDGNVTHKVFLCKVVSEDEATTTFTNLSVELATGTVTNPYDGPFEECPECDNCTTCTPDSAVSVAVNSYSELDAELFAIAVAGGAPGEVLQATSAQILDFNTDLIGSFAADPSSTSPPFDGRVSRIIQANLGTFVSSCLPDTAVIELTATIDAIRTASTPTVSDDGAITIANQTTDAFIASTLIMGGANGEVNYSVTANVTKAELLAGDIVVFIGLQTSEQSLPAYNPVQWDDIVISVSATTTEVCEPQTVEAVKDCDNDRRDALLDALLNATTAPKPAAIIRQRQATLSAGETWPNVTHFVTGSMQSLTVIVEAGTASSQDLVSTLSTTYTVGSYQWGVTGAGETLQFSAFQFDAGSNGKVIWTERN